MSPPPITCPYKVLGLSPSASKDQVKKAYRVEVKKYHPDINKSPMARPLFQRVQMAYEMIERGETGPNYQTPKRPQQQQRSATTYQTTVGLKHAYFGFTTDIAGKSYRLSPGVENGDIYSPETWLRLRVLVNEEPNFRRDGRTLRTNVSVTWKQANKIGGLIRIPHPAFDNGLLFSVKERIDDGDKYILFERGFTDYGKKNRGDYEITFRVEAKPVSEYNPLKIVWRGINRHLDWALKQSSEMQLLVAIVDALVLFAAMVGFSFLLL